VFPHLLRWGAHRLSKLIIVLSLHTPKEKLLGHAYVHWFSRGDVRCIDLNSFDDFIRQVLDPEGERIGLPTLFFPMQRVRASRWMSRVARSRRWPNGLSNA